jgi:CheY-like chemotaxis protein
MVMVQDQAFQVLIIEDDDNTAEVIHTLLKDIGFRPTTVDSG